MTSDNNSDGSDGSGAKRETSIFRVVSVGDIGPTERLLFTVKGQEIVLVNTGDEMLAVGNYCRHQGGPMCEGRLLNPIESDSGGELTQDSDVPTIACPWHGWEYDLETGEHMAPSDYSLPTYPTHVEDGEVYVEV